ncbi:hypothetical protein GCM10009733_048250 [Nonomuraea maheshkhaliensis]|uniref:Transcriptional regulator SbtR-like C-terminal domain-containing protein n=1 Tax=Nonomuraea maheshkhaliensis TaxID=419590 RepID=A0ABN2FHI0_9ACTN
MAAQGLGTDVGRPVVDGLRRAEALTARARQAGEVRDDVTGADIVLLINAVTQGTAPVSDTAPGLWRRYLSMIFDGLRPEAARPLPVPAPQSLAPGRAL